MISASTETYRLLVIEDNPGDYALIEEHLFERNLVEELDHAVRFYEASEKLKDAEKPYDAILLDLNLPDLQGEELIIKTMEIADNAPVIVLTGYSDLEFGIQSLSYGISDYIIKDELTPNGLWKSIRYSIERNLITQQLQDSERRYRDLFEKNPSPMLIWDLKSRCVLDTNMAAERKYGYTKSEFHELTIDDIKLNKSDFSLDGFNHKTSDESTEPAKNIWRHRKKNGGIIFVEVNGHYLQYKDEPASLILMNDVTERIEINERMLESSLQAEELERNRIARELHDGIVQQLAACRMFAENLHDLTDDSEKLEQGIERLQELLKKTTLQTRDLSHNLQSAEFQTMTFSDLVYRLSRQMSAVSGTEFQFIDHLPDQFKVDSGSKVNLYRVIQELYTNIVKHANASKAETVVEHAGDHISISIKDDGTGFDPDHSPGDGFGLANVSNRVFRLGGQIEFSKLNNEGMLITIEVPIEAGSRL